jgi:predicted nucleic acid-binding protein
VIVLDASVAVKWFVDGEPLVAEARGVLHQIADDPRSYVVPELFMNELLAVLARSPGAKADEVAEALSLVETLGLHRVGNGHELLDTAARVAIEWGLSGYDAVYVSLAKLVDGAWLTADRRAADRVRKRSLVRVLGR